MQIARGGMMTKFVFNGQKMRGIVHKSSNVVIQMLQKGTSRDRCFVIGSGYTLNVDEEDKVVWHDPAMIQVDYNIPEDVTVFTYYYTFECEGLDQAALEISEFINNNILREYERLFLIGHSKCGLCLSKVTEYLEDLVRLVTVSTPFDGTIIADYKAVEKKVKSKVLMWMYKKIFSNHNVDLDIIPGSEFLQNLKEPRCIEHINIMSTMKGKRFIINPIDLFLLMVGKVLGFEGDGVVPFSSQMAKADKQMTIKCSHAGSLKAGVAIIEEYSRIMN